MAAQRGRGIVRGRRRGRLVLGLENDGIVVALGRMLPRENPLLLVLHGGRVLEDDSLGLLQLVVFQGNVQNYKIQRWLKLGYNR